ncbi:MAG: hypothetical protein FD174_168 [Geobacteraceae bacterium]|nr:MAG: hypothetical protein FD174_168 [Geobacteraceae bacterium]
MAVISVIMPCLNAEKYIARGIGSVLGQTYGDFELIVVDNGSTDGTRRIPENFNDGRLRVINEPRKGVSRARNRGLTEATGEFVAFLDADDTWREDCLEKLHSALEENSEAVLAYCGWQKVGLPGPQGEPYIPPDYESEGKLEILLRCCPWPIHAVLVRRSALGEARQLFDESLTHAEDYAIWLRVATRRPIVRVPEVMAFYHFHDEGQASDNAVQSAISERKVKREFLTKHPEVSSRFERNEVKELVDRRLLNQGLNFYWGNNIRSAREIFRAGLLGKFGLKVDLKYILLSYLPYCVHVKIVKYFSDR